LGTGNYQQSETEDESVQTELDIIENQFGVQIEGLILLFGRNRNNLGEGTIAEGEAQICNIPKKFSIEEEGGT